MDDDKNKLSIEEMNFAREFAYHGCFLKAARVAFKESGYSDNYLRSGKFALKIMNKTYVMNYIDHLRTIAAENIEKAHSEYWYERYKDNRNNY